MKHWVDGAEHKLMKHRVNGDKNLCPLHRAAPLGTSIGQRNGKRDESRWISQQSTVPKLRQSLLLMYDVEKHQVDERLLVTRKRTSIDHSATRALIHYQSVRTNQLINCANEITREIWKINVWKIFKRDAPNENYGICTATESTRTPFHTI